MAYTVTANTPSAGSIAWTGLHVVLGDNDYTIADGNTALKYLWWDDAVATTSLQTSDTLPVLTGNAQLIFVNNGGTPIVAVGSSMPPALPDTLVQEIVSQASAGGGNHILYLSSAPTATTPGIPGDTAFVYANNVISAQYQCTAGTGASSGNTWTPQQLSGVVITDLDAGSITTGILSGVEINGVTITGSTLQTADSGARIEISGDSNQGSSPGSILLYSGSASETNNGFVQVFAGSGSSVNGTTGATATYDVGSITIQTPQLGANAQSPSIQMQSQSKASDGTAATSEIDITAEKFNLNSFSGNGAYTITGKSLGISTTSIQTTANITFTGGNLNGANGNINAATITGTGTVKGANLNSTGNITASSLTGTGNRAVYSTAAGLLSNTSSASRYKNDVTDLQIDPADVVALKPKHWTWAEDHPFDGSGDGFLAEDLADTSLDPFVFRNASGEVEGIHYAEFAAVAHNVVLTEHEARIEAQQKQIDDLITRLAALEAKGN